MRLPVLVRRHWFEAKDPIRFPDGKASNCLRGGFGIALRTIAPPDAYERIFEPKRVGPGVPSGFADPPRPFLFRAAHLDGQTVDKHDDFFFDVHLFGDPATVDLVTGALDHLLQSGAGVGRGQARLTAIADQNLTIDLHEAEPAAAARVHFLTPTELKHKGRPWTKADFPVLIRRVRDRLWTLLSLYADSLPATEADRLLFTETAEAVQLLRSDLELRSTARLSTRSGHTHSLGGIVGQADYAGPLDAFVPYLRAAYYTGVGRHTVWGNGCLNIEVLSEPSPLTSP
ncbi:MAG: CRISPR system precrRNA processing endoribonuclease RAMP protein Cas6 [Acidobacteria bacterium]|nr:CRISPR system precrRNA processing endoribonuclease RAMP protein Cas6 [Acidobacteriota bacterium]